MKPVSRPRGRWSRRAALLLFGLLAACRPSPPIEGPGAIEPTFVRLFGRDSVDMRLPEPYEQVGVEHRRVLATSDSLITPVQYVDVSPDGSFLLDSILAADDVHPRTAQIEVVFETGQGIHSQLFSVPAGLGRVVLPEFASAEKPCFATLDLLENGGFEGLTHGFVLAPWTIPGRAFAPDEVPIAGRAVDVPEGTLYLELLDPGDGRSVSLVQEAPTPLGIEAKSSYNVRVQTLAEAPEALVVRLSQAGPDGPIVLGEATHPGDGTWRALTFDIAYEAVSRETPLRLELIRRPDAAGVVAVDGASLVLSNARSVRARVRQLPVFESKPVHVDQTTRLEVAYALAGPGRDPTLSPVTFTVSAIDSQGVSRELASSTISRGRKAGAAEDTWDIFEPDLSMLPPGDYAFRFASKANVVRSDTHWQLSDVGSVAWSVPIVYRGGTRDPAPPVERGRPPNIIVISLDTLRADRVGAYGYGKDTTPNIDRFAEDALVFEQCMSTCSWTTPAHASLFSGAMPSAHLAGIPGAGAYERNQLSTRYATVAEHASAQAYLTCAFTEGYFCAGRWGFQQGFDLYSDGGSGDPAPGTVETTFARARDWLERQGDQQFFLFLHTYEIHWPYIPPSRFHDRFVDDDLVDMTLPDPEAYLSGNLTPQQKKVASQLYDAGIAYTDSVLGAFFDFLKAKGLYDDTAILIVSDHGEEFWDHGYVMHGYTLYNEMLHVPFLLKPPRGMYEPGSYSDPISLADAYATLLELMGAPGDPDTFSRSVLPARDTGERNVEMRPYVPSELAQYKREEFSYTIQNATGKYIYTVPFATIQKAITAFDISQYTGELAAQDLGPKALAEGDGIREQYFDLVADPLEQTDLAGPSPVRLEVLRTRLQEAMRATGAAAQRIAPEAGAPLTPEEQQRLATIGYL